MTQEELLILEQRISVERFAPYRTSANGELARAFTLYEQNIEVSAAFWAVLSDLEVLVRNAMHDRLTIWSVANNGRPAWYLDRGQIFRGEAATSIAVARRHAIADGRHETPGRVVAELSFGFWRYLASSRYERSLWLPCLRDAFPGLRGRGMRRDVDDAMRELHLLRNRIAHHEPIYNRSLDILHAQALTVSGWICPVSREWIASRSRVPALLASGPPRARTP